ncbi:MAG: RluA family pseudouridine synthase [Candidatus Omnitrophica bacterium]|nr:RluA family pseudouridine synthase [Candidatus Omnitrophota bacterium]
MEEQTKQKYELDVDIEHVGQRLDFFITDALNGHFSRTYVKKIIESGDVTVNDVFQKPRYIVSFGDHVKAQVPDLVPMAADPENIPLDIVFEDDQIIVVNKPVGLVVHPAPGHYSGTLVNALLYHCNELSTTGGVLRPGIVHRLDRDTSGLIVAVKTDSAHRCLAEQFKNKTAGRKYIALVKGVVQFDNGIINEPIGRHHVERKKMAVSVEGKEAITHYKVIKRFEDFTELEVSLETGRTHQIRVHLAYIGYPILGDKVYGSSKGLNRPALHAKMLRVVHPVTKVPMDFEVPLAKDMKDLINKGIL